ncbi:hypothetical protein MSAN_00921700 [Mycena sanguinolenta]|uniref:DUF1308 domain-containing protein n=1 Tax=Mycena sanguinolenta TaxID=230812 RepID=A0A8H6YUK7_9AGAR|nr:hypothetical protein MSAN_00921700 [Mycena sanguinolenta]
MNLVHPELHCLRTTLRSIHESLSDFRPLAARPPVLDSSTEAITSSSLESPDDGQWLQQENIPGLKQLKDSVKIDLDGLEKFLDDPQSAKLPPLSTNAPYLIAVWNEVLCAPPLIVSVLKSFPSPYSNHPGEPKTIPVKVDVVADSGRRWIRVNTIKNSRILAEFREIDSYLTDSEDEDDPEHGPSLAQKEFDNSLLRMGRSLLAAANANPLDTATGPEPPQVTLRLTRLNPSEPGEDDPRILQTIDCLRAMRIDVQLGEHVPSEIPSPMPAPQACSPAQLIPTANINLDLSVLIALVSDLTHAPLPGSVEEAHLRFAAPPRTRESKHTTEEQEPTIQSRALTSQIMQEMLQEMGRGGMFQELHTRLLPLIPPNGTTPLQFWTTAEAHERFMRIVNKIGGPGEKKRAEVLFETQDFTPEAAEARFWTGSRFPQGFFPILPIRIYPDHSPTDSAPGRAEFFRSMEKTCRDILAHETPATAPQKGAERVLYSNNGFPRNLDSERATVTRANARLTAHTVQSMFWGAQYGWTTLTANKSSVKALLREIRAARVAGRLAEDLSSEAEVDLQEVVAIWIVDPRSLAEGARERAALCRPQ